MDRRWILAGGVLTLAVVGGMWFGRGMEVPSRPPPRQASVSPSASTTLSSPAILVHVAGWVTRPGVVEVQEGSRVAQAVAAAGGVRPGASLASLNLAQVLVDGQQVVVPGPSAVGNGTESPGGLAPGDGLVHLNSATAADLETLPGVGPVLAERIVAHRDSDGPFQRVEDLLEVAGIGESKLAALRERVAVP